MRPIIFTSLLVFISLLVLVQCEKSRERRQIFILGGKVCGGQTNQANSYGRRQRRNVFDRVMKRAVPRVDVTGGNVCGNQIIAPGGTVVDSPDRDTAPSISPEMLAQFKKIIKGPQIDDGTEDATPPARPREGRRPSASVLLRGPTGLDMDS